MTNTEAMNRNGGPVRVGGQALPDGVLMRTERAWAIAHADGSVATGPVPPVRWGKIPVVRVLSALGPALLIGLTGRGATKPDSPPKKRKPPWPLIRGLVIAQLGVMAADQLLSRAQLSAAWGPVITASLLILAIVLFRVATPAPQWRYHGAEHKAVTAHERGLDLTNMDAVLECSRVHARCGTNLIAWMALASAFLGHLPMMLEVPALLLTLAVTAEIVTLAGRYSTSPLARMVLTPGETLQRFLTTSEPSSAEQEVGCNALRACLLLHESLEAESAPALVQA